MTVVVCVVGMPGSGKTHYANSQSNATTFIVDDIRDINELPENGVYERIFITDPFFCITSTREKADIYLSGKYDSVEWVFFENNPERCILNVRYRNDGRLVDRFIQYLTHKYEIPNGVVPMTIWQNPD